MRSKEVRIPISITPSRPPTDVTFCVYDGTGDPPTTYPPLSTSTSQGPCHIDVTLPDVSTCPGRRTGTSRRRSLSGPTDASCGGPGVLSGASS